VLFLEGKCLDLSCHQNTWHFVPEQLELQEVCWSLFGVGLDYLVLGWEGLRLVCEFLYAFLFGKNNLAEVLVNFVCGVAVAGISSYKLHEGTSRSVE